MPGSILSGFSTLRCLEALRRESALDSDSLNKLQAGLFKSLVASASRTGFYHRIEKGPRGMPSEIGDFPITEKEDLRLDPASFISRGAESSYKARTSGSSGVPVEVHSDADALAFRHAFSIASLLDSGAAPLGLCARIHRLENKPGAVRFRYFFRMLGLSLFDDTNANLARLRKAKPSTLICCSSYAGMMAAENLGEREPLSFRSVVCGSESLQTESRKRLSESFSCPVFEVYGCHEFGFMAWECPEEHSMHVNSRIMLEIVDRGGKPVKGGPGDVLVTALHNRAMPLIRYRIGDRASWGKGCACGRGTPVLSSIEGRTNEVFVLPDGRIRPSSCFFNIEPVFDGVNAYQLVQERDGHFVLKYVPFGKGLGESARKEVASIIRKACLGAEVRVEFEEAESLPREKSGKFRKFISLAVRRARGASPP